MEYVLSRAQALQQASGSQRVLLEHVSEVLQSLPGGPPTGTGASASGGAASDALTKQQLEDTMKQMLFNQVRP